MAITALSKTGIGQSQSARTGQHLAALEMQARARVAATEAKREPAVSSRLHVARQYRDATDARHAEVLKAYRAAQERLAAVPEPRQSLKDRILGRQPSMADMKALEHAVAIARDDLIAAERAATGGQAHFARVEKAEAAERVQRMGQVETERRAAMEMLGEVVMAQRMAKAFPAMVYCGPIFTAWAGGKVERKRKRGLRNPWAVNMWGLPLDFS
jgi:hypothetical protein